MNRSTRTTSINEPRINVHLNLVFQKFLLKKYLLLHMKRYHQEDDPSKPLRSEAKKHPCSHCGKRFMYENDRREHENTHLGIRDHKCKCGKSYSSRKALLQHQKLAHEEAQNQEMLSCNVSINCSRQFFFAFRFKRSWIWCVFCAGYLSHVRI